MPLYRNSSTGDIVERSERYVLAYPEGKYTLVGETYAERKARERRLAEEEKVNLEDADPVEPIEVLEAPSPIKKGRK